MCEEVGSDLIFEKLKSKEFSGFDLWWLLFLHYRLQENGKIWRAAPDFQNFGIWWLMSSPLEPLSEVVSG